MPHAEIPQRPGQHVTADHVAALTRRFYREFRGQQAEFQQVIQGIRPKADRQWYATLTLIRLMFLYFLQADGLLDGDQDYLRWRFAQSAEPGRTHRPRFFRNLLLPLFHDGLARHRDRRPRKIARLLGGIPYLGCGLFGQHPLERAHPRINIPDDAFPPVFAFLDQYAWRFRGRSPRTPGEITPDILGHVFERFVNQRQMGAYYTPEDVTDYIARATLLPALLDALPQACDLSGRQIHPPWERVRRHAQRYVPAAVRGAPRRDLLRRLRDGAVQRGSDFVTLNLDLARFVQDALQETRQLPPLLAWYRALTGLTVLDPTCGSGAFLFAAIRTLAPVYEACLQRLQEVLQQTTAGPCPADDPPQSTAAEILDQAGRSPSRRFFVLSTLLQRNLHGVDLMPEAVELCRLRLLLSLVAEVPAVDFDQLPAVSEFSIRVGDVLATRAAVPQPPRTPQQPQSPARSFDWQQAFPHVMQRGGFIAILGNPPYVRVTPQRVPPAVRGTRTASCPDLYAWCMERAAELGSPQCRVGMIVPLSLAFSRDFAPLRQMLREEYAEHWFSHFGRIPSALFRHDVRTRNTIHLAARQAAPGGSHTTRLHRWFDAERPGLFASLQYAAFQPAAWPQGIPKLDSSRLASAWERCLTAGGRRVADLLADTPAAGPRLYFKKTAYNWLAFSRRPPPCYDVHGRAIDPPQIDTLTMANPADADLLFLLLNGRLMFVHWAIVGDDFHVTRHSLTGFPIPEPARLRPHRRQLAALANQLERALQQSLCFKQNAGKRVGSYNLARCRHVTDRSDRLLAPLLGLDRVWDEIQALYRNMLKTDFPPQDSAEP